MSDTAGHEPRGRGSSSGSRQTVPSLPLQPTSDPSAPRRVCFYKSGDYTFSGHRMVINARTFKTFDALLDALAKKVPLPFGVRTITTPRGINPVKALDDLLDGGSYVCSDNKRVKPLNLDEVNRRQVPWNATRPLSAGRRRQRGPKLGPFGGKSEAIAGRQARVGERGAVRTPKRLVVVRNRDPTVKRTIVLQRRIAPTFDALLDYLSQILQFSVLKLFSTDGRRIDSLAALILCSGVVVAAGSEPFRLGTYSFHAASQMAQVMYVEAVEPSMLQPATQNNKSLSSGRGSRNFSFSSERYIVDQIQKSRNGTTEGRQRHRSGSAEAEVTRGDAAPEARGTGRVEPERRAGIVPRDDDIEKSFCVNQDGSMTVEMKVRLTIKEEEMLHWTTTLSRSSLSKGTVCASLSEPANSSPESCEENRPVGPGRLGVDFHTRPAGEGHTSVAVGNAKSGPKRAATPGPRRVTEKASVESVKTTSESGVQESTLGRYSYTERRADGEKTEGYCMVKKSSSSSSSRSNERVPKTRTTASAVASSRGCRSSARSSAVGEVCRIQNNGMEVTETVMHIYESQGCYDNYSANEEYSAESGTVNRSTPAPESKPSTESGHRSSGNDCDIDLSWQPPTTHSQQRQKEEMLSLSSEPVTPSNEVTAAKSQKREKGKKDKTPKSEAKKKTIKAARNEEGLTSTSSSGKKQKPGTVSPPKNCKDSSTDRLSSDAGLEKNTLSSSESAKSGKKSRSEGAKRPQINTPKKNNNMPRKDPALLNAGRTPPKRLNTGKPAAKDNGHNVNTPTGRPQMKKNLSDILQPKKSLLPAKKTISRPKSMTESRVPSPKTSLQFPESPMPSLTPSPSEVHQYVENWLDKVRPDPVPYTEEAVADEAQPPAKVFFKIGDDSESEEKAESPPLPDEALLSPGDAIRRSASLADCREATAPPHGEQRGRALCASMPSVRVDLAQEQQQEEEQEEEQDGPRPRPTSGGSAASTPNLLRPKANTGHVLHDLYSSIHCIRSACEAEATPGLEKSSSLPNISTQVASVFGSSCKAFMSFLSVMTLRDNLTAPALGDGVEHEALLTLESLQRISAAEDEEELRASLTDLQSRASPGLRERWGDFQTLREKLESEPLSPKFSDTEFALDVASEAGDAHEDIEELMDELNMPQDLRAEISSTIQQAKSFYPVEESTFVENERDPSDSEDDLEQFVECNNVRKPEPETTSVAGDITPTKGDDDHGEIDELETKQPMYSESEHEHDKEPEISHTDTAETLEDKENDEEDEEVVEGWKEEEGTEDERTTDEEEDGEKQGETQRVSMDEDVPEARERDSVEETDEREGNDDTEEEEDEGVDVKRLGDETEEEADEEVSDGGGEVDISMAEVREEEEDDAGGSRRGTCEGEEVGVIKVDAEEEADQSMGETDGEGVENIEQSEEEEEGEEEEEEADPDDFTEVVEEEAEEDFEDVEKDTNQEMIEVIEEKDEEEDEGNIINEIEDVEEEETEALTEKPVDGELIEEKDEDDEKTEVESEEIDMDEEEREQELVEEGEDAEVKNIKEQVVTDEEDEEDQIDRNMEEEEKRDEGEESEKELQETVNGLEDESVGEKEVDMEAEQSLDEKEREDDEERESKDFNEGSNEPDEHQSKDAVGGGRASEDADATDRKPPPEEASYPQRQGSCDEADAKAADPDSPTRSSPECPCEDDKGNGTDSADGVQTDEGAEPAEEEGNGTPQHPVEISQELLDFVNSALQSSSLVFTYDARGNVRLETDRVTRNQQAATPRNRVAQNKQPAVPKTRKDISYGSKRLPSPSTSGLSDYRPETSESGGYKTQESVDVVTDSGEEAPACRKKPVVLVGGTDAQERADREPPRASDAVSQDSRQNGGGSFSPPDPPAEATKKADAEPAAEAAGTPGKDSADGVLIDRGRWLLKENHLIRKSPPVSLGMYGQLDSTSGDTGPDDASQGSPSRRKFQNDPLAAVSSSDLEEMAKPPTPKCTYYNMPHGSDSDPFSDDASVKSAPRGRGFRVSPAIDTSKTWTNKKSSTSSFASVEFKIPDRKVHPEGDSSAVARWTPGGGRSVLQAQDSRDTLHVRCSRYCPIL